MRAALLRSRLSCTVGRGSRSGGACRGVRPISGGPCSAAPPSPNLPETSGKERPGTSGNFQEHPETSGNVRKRWSLCLSRGGGACGSGRSHVGRAAQCVLWCAQLSSGKQDEHVSYRDSKLTLLLQARMRQCNVQQKGCNHHVIAPTVQLQAQRAACTAHTDMEHVNRCAVNEPRGKRHATDRRVATVATEFSRRCRASSTLCSSATSRPPPSTTSRRARPCRSLGRTASIAPPIRGCLYDR